MGCGVRLFTAGATWADAPPRGRSTAAWLVCVAEAHTLAAIAAWPIGSVPPSTNSCHRLPYQLQPEPPPVRNYLFSSGLRSYFLSSLPRQIRTFSPPLSPVLCG